MKDSPTQNTQDMGKFMMFMAWVLFLGLLVLFFYVWDGKDSRPKVQVVTKDGITETVITRNRDNQYIAMGAINGRSVPLLLDTGANHVVIPGGLAKELQLPRGMEGVANTAGGNVVVYTTKLNSLIIGHIELHNITAMINPKMKGNEVLLGMSALKRVTFTQSNDQLILTVPKNTK